jgi:UTP--glucose-1-phosphate uridylyltransferase
LTPDVFDYIERGKAMLTDEQEFYLTTFVLEPMIQDGKTLIAALLKDAQYYDTGNKLEYLKTVVDFALKDKQLSEEFLTYLKGVIA